MNKLRSEQSKDLREQRDKINEMSKKTRRKSTGLTAEDRTTVQTELIVGQSRQKECHT